jgi:hypothetical protein
MEVKNITKTNESAWGDSIKISPLLIPNKDLPRVDADGNSFIISFTEEQIKTIYDNWVETSSTQPLNSFILQNELLDYPAGTWVIIDETTEGYSIECIIDCEEFKK